jgi:hypothetical protein
MLNPHGRARSLIFSEQLFRFLELRRALYYGECHARAERTSPMHRRRLV